MDVSADQPAPRDADALEFQVDENDRHLGLWDAVSIIVGIVVGTAIFKAPPLVFGGVSNLWQGLGCWVLAGVLMLVGSICYAELGTTYQRMGGDYVYLTRAYGRWSGFLFGWAQLAVILTGSTGAMAYAFADYGIAFFGLSIDWSMRLAVISVVGLTLFNLAGVIVGKAIQNLLSIVKIVGLAAIVVVGFAWGGDASLEPAEPLPFLGFGLSMVLVLYAYGGWNDAAFVAAEVRNPSRNIPLALILGTGGIMVVYLLVNAAYVYGIGFTGLRESRAPAADVFQMAWGDRGGKAISLLVMLSALGAINGLIFTGSRVYASLGADHRVFGWLGSWSGRRGAPIGALIAQGVIALLLILIVGTDTGRTQMDAALGRLGFRPLPGEQTMGGFETLVAGTAPVFWLFFMMTSISVFVLRRKDRELQRPFSAPLYPLEPLLFCGMCGYMLYSSIAYARGLSLLGFVPLAIGVPLYVISEKLSHGKKHKPDAPAREH